MENTKPDKAEIPQALLRLAGIAWEIARNSAEDTEESKENADLGEGVGGATENIA